MLRRLLPMRTAENVFFAVCGLIVILGFVLVFTARPPQMGEIVGVAGLTAAVWVRCRLWTFDLAGTARAVPGVGTPESPHLGSDAFIAITRPRRRGSGGVLMVNLDGREVGCVYPGGRLVVEVSFGDHGVQVTRPKPGLARCASPVQRVVAHRGETVGLCAERIGATGIAYIAALRRKPSLGLTPSGGPRGR